MRKTSNYNLSLYDKEDKLIITAEEDSLNANMEIIDETLKEKTTIQDMTDYIEKHKDELKGEDGKDGINGVDGKDGYTPVKGVDYFDGVDGKDGTNGNNGEDGRGISKIEKTNTVGLVDTYTITYTDGTTSTYTVTNGKDGEETEGEPIYAQATNLINDYNFANYDPTASTPTWLWYDSSGLREETTSLSEEGLCLHLDNVTVAMHSLRQKLTKSKFVAGHTYYLRAKVKYDGTYPKNSVPAITFTGSTPTILDSTAPAKSGWTTITAIATLPSISASSLYLMISNNYKSMDYDTVDGTKIYFNNVMCVDLTAMFGAGNEPTDIAVINALVEEQYDAGFSGTVDVAVGKGESPLEKLTTQVEEIDGRLVTAESNIEQINTTIANLPTGGTQDGSVYPILEDYFIGNIEEALPKYYEQQDVNTLTFTMMGDMHLKANNTTILKNVEASSAWAKLVNNDFIMMGGDFIIGDENKTASLGYMDALMEMAEKHANCPVYAVKGNHDTCDETGDNANRITPKELYQHINARGEKHGMVIDPAHPYAGYYYVDFPKQKIRMVCLNTTETKEEDPNSTWSGVKTKYQAEWVRDVALRVDEGWAVMMVSHIPPITGANLGITDEEENADIRPPFHNRGIDSPAIYTLCEAFMKGTSGTTNITTSGSLKTTYDFTTQGPREFIGHFCGHVHEDSLSVYTGSDAENPIKLNYIVVNSTTPTKRWSTSLERTANEDKLSLNSFIIDRATRTVKCIKIGSAPAEDYEWWADSFTWDALPTQTTET